MGDAAVRAFEAAFPPVEHPVVITHPETGRKALFVNPSYTVRIAGIEAAESDALLRFLFRHMTQARFQLRHHWTQNDVVVWDERATQHSGSADHRGSPRTLRRCTIAGERPF